MRLVAKAVTKLGPVGAVGQAAVAAEAVAQIDRHRGSANAWTSRVDSAQAMPMPAQRQHSRVQRERRPPDRNKSLQIVLHAIPVSAAIGVNAVAISAATVLIPPTRPSAMRSEQTRAANADRTETVGLRKICARSCQTPIAQRSVLRVRQIQQPRQKALHRANDAHVIVTDVIVLPVLNAPNKAINLSKLFARPSL
jgi:hypothetical protein